jgi:hypothetical protein
MSEPRQGRHIQKMSLLTEREILLTGFYKYVAPMALGTAQLCYPQPLRRSGDPTRQ